MAQTLASAARRARFSTRGHMRGRLVAGGFRARPGQQAFNLATQISFLLLVVIPSLSAIVYFVSFASNQYAAEARFTLRPGRAPISDGLNAVTGIPSALVVQDTQIVVNYIRSSALLEKLAQQIDLTEVYSRSDIDWYARLKPGSPIEKLERYWKSMTDVEISMPGGIVIFTVRAFQPEDATKIANVVIELCEQMVNEMNDRIRQDTLAAATTQLQIAGERIASTRDALETARNAEGMLDAGVTADSVNLLISQVDSNRLKLQHEYESQAKFVSTDAPQMRNLKARIEAAQAQRAELAAQLTSNNHTRDPSRVVSASMTKLAELSLEQQIAEQEFSLASTSLQRARIVSDMKLEYLNQFVSPMIPEEARYPRRFAGILVVVAGALGVWGGLFGLAVLVRNNMAR
jgi:capsular polysaccharide transport system permease protein